MTMELNLDDYNFRQIEDPMEVVMKARVTVGEPETIDEDLLKDVDAPYFSYWGDGRPLDATIVPLANDELYLFVNNSRRFAGTDWGSEEIGLRTFHLTKKGT